MGKLILEESEVEETDTEDTARFSPPTGSLAEYLSHPLAISPPAKKEIVLNHILRISHIKIQRR